MDFCPGRPASRRVGGIRRDSPRVTGLQIEVGFPFDLEHQSALENIAVFNTRMSVARQNTVGLECCRYRCRIIAHRPFGGLQWRALDLGLVLSECARSTEAETEERRDSKI